RAALVALRASDCGLLSGTPRMPIRADCRPPSSAASDHAAPTRLRHEAPVHRELLALQRQAGNAATAPLAVSRLHLESKKPRFSLDTDDLAAFKKAVLALGSDPATLHAVRTRLTDSIDGDKAEQQKHVPHLEFLGSEIAAAELLAQDASEKQQKQAKQKKTA